MLVINTTGKTDWAPDTKKFILYDWQTGKHPLAVAIAADAKDVRKCPRVIGAKMAYAELREWQAHGSPLRCVAIVAVTKNGWRWTPYDGQISWAARDYRAEYQNTKKYARAT